MQCEALMKVEIPYGSNIKYEIGSDGRLMVDRVLHTPVKYPFNYGALEGTLAGDGDELDAVLITRKPFYPGCYIRVKIIGGLYSRDEKGVDEKIFVVPVESVDPSYKEVNHLDDLGHHVKEQIRWFFENYKKLEPNKHVNVGRYLSRGEAIRVYEQSQRRHEDSVSTSSSEEVEIEEEEDRPTKRVRLVFRGQ